MTRTVPPHQMMIYDMAGSDVAGKVNMLHENDRLVLTCEVRGGE